MHADCNSSMTRKTRISVGLCLNLHKWHVFDDLLDERVALEGKVNKPIGGLYLYLTRSKLRDFFAFTSPKIVTVV